MLADKYKSIADNYNKNSSIDSVLKMIRDRAKFGEYSLLLREGLTAFEIKLLIEEGFYIEKRYCEFYHEYEFIIFWGKKEAKFVDKTNKVGD